MESVRNDTQRLDLQFWKSAERASEHSLRERASVSNVTADTYSVIVDTSRAIADASNVAAGASDVATDKPRESKRSTADRQTQVPNTFS